MVPFSSRLGVVSLAIACSVLVLAFLVGADRAPTVAAQSDASPLVRLKVATFDPLQAEPSLAPDLKAEPTAATERANYLVQFHKSVPSESKAELEKLGAKIYGYIPDNTLLVRMDGATRDAVGALPDVRWVGLYHPAYKIAPQLSAATEASVPVVLMTFDPTETSAVMKAVWEQGGTTQRSETASRWGVVQAQVAPTAIAALARRPEVRWIERYSEPRPSNDVARGSDEMNVDTVQTAHGLTGAGQVVGHADTGLDVGVLDQLHPDLRNQVKSVYAWGRRTIWSFATVAGGPMGLAWDGSTLWSIDWSTRKLYHYSAQGVSLSTCTPNVASTPAGLAWDGSYLWFVERSNDTVYQIDTNCAVRKSFHVPGVDPYPMGLAWDGQALWVSDDTNNKVYQVKPDGTLLKTCDAPGPAGRQYPSSLAWVDGALFVGDTGVNAIFKLDSACQVTDEYPIPDEYASGMTWDGSSLWVSDAGLDRIFKTSLTPTPNGDWSDPDGHGTHTAGSILGTGAAYQGTGTASLGQYRGIAPGAKLVHQSTLAGDGSLRGLPLTLEPLLQQAYDDGARIHSDSWGSGAAGQYTIVSAEADAFTWDHKDMLPVFAAGNEGQDANVDGVVDPDSIGSPATAKNVLTVGASENKRPTFPYTGGTFGLSANPVKGGRVADNPNGLAAFSSRGPTDDGRIKPDIVAPGTAIVSTRTQVRFLLDDMESPPLAARADAAGDAPPTVQCEKASTRDLGRQGGVGLPSGAAGDMEVCTATLGASPAPTGPSSLTAPETGVTWTAQGNWQRVTTVSHSPSHSWGNTYTAGVTQWLRSSPVDIQKAAHAVSLGFWTRYNIPSGDRGFIGVSTDGNNYRGFSISGSQSDWVFKSLLIPWGCYLTGPSSYYCIDDPRNVTIAFVMISNSDANTGSWYVDDVGLFGAGWGLMSGMGMSAYNDPVDRYYIPAGGTSMATPLTAGAAALVRQYYAQAGIEPSAALVKATLIDGATDMTPGQYGVGSSGPAKFSDDMEHGTVNWSPGSWGLTTSQSHSATHSWTDSASGNYSNNTDSSLLLNQAINLTQVPSPGLVFWQRYDIEYYFDNGYVEISTDNGATWTPLAAVTGTGTTWQRAVIDLSAYSTATSARFRFRLKTDDSVTKDGWYIDDVSVQPVSFQEITARPDNNQGWGRVNLERSLFPAAPRQHSFRDDLTLATGQSYQHPLQVTAATEPLRVTLAWTDYPSETSAAVNLVNDLDLKVTGPDGHVYYPNGLGSADRRNNVEGIEIANPSLGQYILEVRGQNVPMGPQPFALVVSGATQGLVDVTPLPRLCPAPYCVGLPLIVREDAVRRASTPMAPLTLMPE